MSENMTELPFNMFQHLCRLGATVSSPETFLQILEDWYTCRDYNTMALFTSSHWVPGSAIGDAALLDKVIVACHITWRMLSGHRGVIHSVNLCNVSGSSSVTILSFTTDMNTLLEIHNVFARYLFVAAFKSHKLIPVNITAE